MKVNYIDRIRFQNISKSFFSGIEDQLSTVGFSIPLHWSIDHLCYRVETIEKYYLMKKAFSTIGKELTESQVNGRPIATFKLTEPIFWKNWKIDILELPAPKMGKSVKEGLEHIEIVSDMPFDELNKLFPISCLDKSGMNKLFNQELEVKLNGCSIKFHHMSLESVINLESNKRVFHSIESLGILKTLQDFEPLIAGTFPLGVNGDHSDVDILLYTNDLNILFSKFDDFSYLDKFKKHKNVEFGYEYVLCSFTYENIPFELFGQTVRSVCQRAYTHFQIEERLLKLGNESFQQAIRYLRLRGEKTEPAFAKALGLTGDSYIALLDISKSSEKYLTELLKGSGY